MIVIKLLILLHILLGVSGGRNDSTVYRVCTSPWAPFVMYNETTKAFYGYEADLFDMVATKLGLQYTIEVMDWGAMMDGLLRPLNDSARCDIAPASIPVTTSDLANSMQFSIPTFRSGYAVAVGVLDTKTDYWAFTKVFAWDVWLALFVSGVGISVLVWIAERDFARRGMGKVKYPAELRPGMYEAVYRTYGKLLNTVDEPRVTSLPARIIVMGWGVVVLVTISTYTAGLTARLTAVTTKTKITGINDLAGYKVGTWDVIAKSFIKYGIRPEGLPWSTEADGLAMLEMVAAGKLDALILDSPWLRYQVSDRCDVTIVGRMFQYVNNAVGFNAHLPQDFIAAYNAVLSQLLEDGFYETLEAAYLRDSKCGSVDPTTTITFWNLTGVYIIMVACVGLGLLLLVLPHISARFDMDVQGGTSLDDRDKSFVSRTVSRIGRAFSATGTREQPQPSFNGGGSRVVPEVSGDSGGFARKGSQTITFALARGAASLKEPPLHTYTGGTSRSVSAVGASPTSVILDLNACNSDPLQTPPRRVQSELAGGGGLPKCAGAGEYPEGSGDGPGGKVGDVQSDVDALAAVGYTTGMPRPDGGKSGRFSIV